MKIQSLLFIALSFSQIVFAQVPKKVIVEHFTNTLCSVCNSRNPGFYGNLSNHSDILHLSIHSSTPYSSCLLYQQNPTSSNARKAYYSIASTPTLIINGFTIPGSSNYTLPSLFTPFTGQTSPVSIRMEQQKYGSDSIKIRVIVKTEAAHSLGTQQLWVGLAEDTVFYNAPNGEARHYDVFRTQLGLSNLTLPATVGDSLVYNYMTTANVNWNFGRIFAFALLQNTSNKSVNQAEATSPSTNNFTTSIADLPSEKIGISIFPNPATDIINIVLERPISTTVYLYNLQGQLVQQKDIEHDTTLSVGNLPSGIYFLRCQNEVLKLKIEN